MFGISQESKPTAVLQQKTTTNFYISDKLFLFIEDQQKRTFTGTNGYSVVTGGHRTKGGAYQSGWMPGEKTFYLAEQHFKGKRVVLENVDMLGRNTVGNHIKVIEQVLREAADACRIVEAFEVPATL